LPGVSGYEQVDVVCLAVYGLEMVGLVFLADVGESRVQVVFDVVDDDFAAVFGYEYNVVFDGVNTCTAVLNLHMFQPFVLS
jgi:hypothetical protein